MVLAPPNVAGLENLAPSAEEDAQWGITPPAPPPPPPGPVARMAPYSPPQGQVSSSGAYAGAAVPTLPPMPTAPLPNAEPPGPAQIGTNGQYAGFAAPTLPEPQGVVGPAGQYAGFAVPTTASDHLASVAQALIDNGLATGLSPEETQHLAQARLDAAGGDVIDAITKITEAKDYQQNGATIVPVLGPGGALQTGLTLGLGAAGAVPVVGPGLVAKTGENAIARIGPTVARNAAAYAGSVEGAKVGEEAGLPNIPVVGNVGGIVGGVLPGAGEALAERRIASITSGRPTAGAKVTPSASPPPVNPGVFDQEPGFTGAQAALDSKEATTLKPGRLLQGEVNPLRAAAGVFNPAANTVKLPREVDVANKARVSVKAQLFGEFSRTEGAAAKAAEEAWARDPATFTGTAGPGTGTLADYLERPSQYQASQRLTDAKNALKATQDANIARVRSDYGVDIKPYQVADPEGIYVPHVLNTDNLETQVQRTSAGLSGTPGVAKTRVYDTLAERLAKDPVFAKSPELDVAKLMDIHSQSLATAAANDTFKLGVGGKTRVEVLDELHPNLRAAKEGAQRQVDQLKGRLDTALGQQGASIRTFRATASQIRQIENRMNPIDLRIQQLGPDYGPELSHLSGQLHELELRRAALERLSTGKLGPNVVAGGAKVGGLQTQIAAAEAKVADLVKSYQSAGIDAEKYVMSPDTYRYHEPATAKAVNGILKTRFDSDAIERALSAMDEVRGTALGPDFSPLSIQGILGALSHPMTLITHAGSLARAAFSDRALTEGLKPEEISRFEFASGRTYGQPGREFRQSGRGAERIPGIGKGIGAFNEALTRVTERGQIQAFLDDSNLLQKFKGLSQDKADAEAMSTLSKLVPSRNPAETGRSVQRSRLERLPVISTSFISAPAELAKDYASGVAKILTGRPGQLEGRELLALYRGTMLATTTSGIAIASALVSAPFLHQTPEQAVKSVLNPGSSKFLSIVLPNGSSIGLGGPHRSFIRAVAPGWDRDGNFRLFAGGNPLSFADAKLNPAFSTGLDLYRNKDFRGNTIASGTPLQQAKAISEYLVENANITVGAALEPLRTGQNNSPTEIGTQVVSQLAGTNYREASKTDKRDTEARSMGLADYASASGDQKKAINDKLGTQSAGIDVRHVSNTKAADDWLRMNKGNGLGSEPIQYKNFYRNLNETKESRQAWDASKELLQKYDAIVTPERLAQFAGSKDAPARKQGEDDATYKARVADAGKAAIQAAYRVARPELDAWLAFWGAETVVHSSAAGKIYEDLLKKYAAGDQRTGQPKVKLAEGAK